MSHDPDGGDPPVKFHIDHPDDSRENSQRGASPLPASTDRTVGMPLDTHRRNEVEMQRSPGPNIGMERARADGGTLAGTVAPGFANDAVYGSDRTRAKVEGGAAHGYYDEKEGKYKEDLPPAGMGERLGAGLTRPTNLTAGERPHKGHASAGVDDWTETTYEKVASLPPRDNGWWPHWASLPAFWYPWNVNAQAYRLGMIPVITICLLGTDKRHHRWMYYVVLALTVDYFCRMVAGPRASICTLFGECLNAMMRWCRTSSAPKGFFPRSCVAGAPYQFSDLMGLIILIAATVCFFDGDNDDSDIAGAVLLAFQALVAFLELFLGFPPWVWVFNQMVHFGWVWKDAEIKAALIREENQRMEVSEELAMATARQQLAQDKDKGPNHLHFNGNSKRSLPYSYRTANEYHKRLDFNPFRNVKTHYFLAPATLACLSWAWVVASRDGVFGTPDLVWQILIIAALCLFALEFLFYMGKIMFFTNHMMWEWEHPIYRSTFLAIPLAWLLFIPAIVAANYPTLAEVVFWMGAPLFLFLCILQLSYHIHQNFFFENFGGAWMLIPLGCAVCAYMLTIVHNSYREVAWLWLGIALFMWIIFSTLLWLKSAFSPRQREPHRYHAWSMMGTAFAIAIALAGIYGTTAMVSTTTTNTGGTPITTTTGGTALTTGGTYDVQAQGDGLGTLLLPELSDPSLGSVINVYSSGQSAAYSLIPSGANTLNGGGGPFVISPDDGGASCVDDSPGGSTAGWTCTLLGANSSSSTDSYGVWHDLGLFAFYVGLVLFLVLFLLTLHGFFGRGHWDITWWIVPLSLCLMAVATLFYHALWHSATTQGIATTAMVIANIACALMFLNHLRALLSGELYRPGHLMLSPLEFFRLPNKALREVLFVLQGHMNNPKATVDEWKEFDTILLPRYMLSTSVMSYAKRGALYPVIAAWFGSNIFRAMDENARALDDELIRIVEEMRTVQSLPVNSEQRIQGEAKMRADFATYVSGVTANMDEEEVHIFPLARRYIGGKEANAMVRKSWDEVPPHRWAEVIPFIMTFLHSDHLRTRWLECFLHAAPEHGQLVGKFVYEAVDPFTWERIVIDTPEIRPRLTRGYTRVW